MIREIPGFYYGKILIGAVVCRRPGLTMSVDAEKNKYFKIQANHTGPAGARYSNESIKAAKQNDKVRSAIVIIFSIRSFCLCFQCVSV